MRDLVPDDPTIRLIHIESGFGFTVGEKRNFGVERAAGSVIAHWDDDDYSAPTRLDDQVGRLLESKTAVIGYSTMLFTDGSGWWRYQGLRSYALGTSLCYRKDWWASHRFPARNIGEDNAFTANARGCQQLMTMEAGELMVATIHNGNTSPRNLTGSNWKKVIAPPTIQGFNA